MPYCHFELEDSDYITSARRNPEMKGPGGAPAGTTLDPNTRVIEFETTGVSIKATKWVLDQFLPNNIWTLRDQAGPEF